MKGDRVTSSSNIGAAKPKAEEPARQRLGRGLAALIGDSGTETDAIVRSRGQKRVPIEFLKQSTFNPRTMFDEGELAELADSIREKGIIQPILVRTKPGVADTYEIIAGERRWRAAMMAGLHDVPVFTIEADDRQALEIAIIENVQRTNLNVLEEAQGYERLSEEFGYSQGDLARVIGKSRPHVNNTLRLLKLPADTRYLLSSGQISAGHARALLNAEDPNSLSQRIVQRGLSVRAVEDIVKREVEAREFGPPPQRVMREKDADTRALERRISDQLGLAVDIKHYGDSGEMRLKYTSLEQLDRLVAILGG
jgi:ParB family chromosome partitioning protein